MGSLISVMNYLHDIAVVALFCAQHDVNGNCRLFHTRPSNLTHRLYNLISSFHS